NYRLAVPAKTPGARLGKRALMMQGRPVNAAWSSATPERCRSELGQTYARRPAMRIRLSPTSIGRWSARRPWLAIAVWLACVVLAVAALSLTGSKSLQGGVTGEAARAETMLNAHNAQPAQKEFAYIHSGSLRTGDPRFRAAIAKVAGSMERAL